jgi:hypothetical protein
MGLFAARRFIPFIFTHVGRFAPGGMKFHNERSFCLCHASCSRAADALCDALVLPLARFQRATHFLHALSAGLVCTEDKIGTTDVSNNETPATVH